MAGSYFRYPVTPICSRDVARGRQEAGQQKRELRTDRGRTKTPETAWAEGHRVGKKDEIQNKMKY